MRERKERTALSSAAILGMIGKVVLDRYEIEAELGSGAMGSVYRGKHVKLPRKVAIKIMHEELAAEPTLLERFHREAQVAAKLHHANVVAVLDTGETPEGKHVMVMEYAEGKSLATLMTARLPRDRMLKIIEQLLRGLDHAHATGLVHRDLKPDNVIVGEGDIPRIVDFGIAALRGGDDGQVDKLTGTGMIIGTPMYMAPEQAKGERVDHRADLYALGIMMFEMLSGAAPFSGTAMEIAVAKIDKDPPPLHGVEPLLDAFMRKLVARQPDDRFASAHAALAALELVDSDPPAAALALGIMDVAKAIAVVSLPDPSR
jgi:serine/threonine-protein kinase